ncbi:MAG: pilus assembly protein PilM, partial [Lachnospiraceae bacterium]|nr:pilus assembly protein PilM [Lachnospiraceae bacterium]
SNSLISIRIGKKYVKICELQYASNNKSVYVNRILKAKIPEGVVEDGFIMDFFAAETFFNSIIKENKMTATDAIFSISSGKIATKEITTPIMKEKQLVEMIHANASEYFPIYLDDYILAHNVLDKGNAKKGINQMQVLVLAAPKDLIDDYFKLAERLKINIKSIDYAGNSAYQMIRRQIHAETSLVIQIQEETTTVNILKDNILKLQRTIPYGKNLPIEALCEKLKIDEDEAATLLETERHIHETFDGDPVTESIRPIINNVLRIVDYYNSRNTEDPVEKAYLVGESVSLLGVDFLFANEFEVSVNQLVKFNGVTLEKENEVLHRIVTKYVGCLGAGIEPVDFMPKDKLDKARSANTFRLLKLGVLASLVVAIIACAIPVTKLVIANADKDNVQKQIDNLKSIEEIVNDYYKSYDMYTDAKNFKDMTDGNNDSLIEFIDTLEQKMPSDISVKSISFNEGQVSITCSTSTKDTVAKFIEALENTSNVYDVFVSAIAENKDADGVITTSFTLTCQFVRIADGVDIIQAILDLNLLNYDELLASTTGEDARTIEDIVNDLIDAFENPSVDDAEEE